MIVSGKNILFKITINQYLYYTPINFTDFHGEDLYSIFATDFEDSALSVLSKLEPEKNEVVLKELGINTDYIVSILQGILQKKLIDFVSRTISNPNQIIGSKKLSLGIRLLLSQHREAISNLIKNFENFAYIWCVSFIFSGKFDQVAFDKMESYFLYGED